MKKISLFLILVISLSITLPVYANSIENFEGDYAIFEVDGKYGVVDKDGNITVEPIWEDMIRITMTHGVMVQDGKGGLIDLTTGKIIATPRFTGIKGFVGKNWLGVVESQYFYVYDITTGKTVHPSESHIETYYSPAYDIPHAILDDGRRSYRINNDSYLVIDEKYLLKGFSENIGIISAGEYYGLVDQNGVVTLEANTWHKIHRFRDGIALAEKDDKTYVINEKGDVLLESQWDTMDRFYKGRALISNDGLYGLVDSTGNVLVPTEYDELQRSYANTSAPLVGRKGNLFSYIDVQTGVILVDNLSYAWEFKDGYALAKRGDKKIVIDTTGQEPMKIPDGTSDFENGIAVLFGTDDDDLTCVGFINIKGEVISEPQWDGTLGFHEGFAAVRQGEAWGYVPWDEWEKEHPDSIPAGFTKVGDPVWQLLKEGKWGFIDTNGQLITEIEFDEIENFKNGRAIVLKDGQWGFIDTTGKLLFQLPK